MTTNEWPSGVTNKAAESGIPPGVSDSSGCDSTVSELVSEIKPRYVFTERGLAVYNLKRIMDIMVII